MAKYGLLIDISKCNGCYNCFLACRDEHCGNDHYPIAAPQPYSGHFWMRVIERERGSFPRVKVAYTAVPCMHCEKPACVEQAGDGAVYKRPDGIVIIDPVKAKGRKDIVSSCPYRVIYWNEELQLPQKCTLCAHLLDEGWKEPRCVEACPTGALMFGDLDDAGSEIAQALKAANVEALHPEYGLDPKVVYHGLPKRFIAGSVVLADNPDECPEGVKVTLKGPGTTLSAGTDNYGDFEFEDLEPDTEYSLKIEQPGYQPQELTVKTRIDTCLGDIVLSKKD